MREIILADRYKAQETIKEERDNWVMRLLVALGMNNEEVVQDNADILFKYGLEVWDDLSNGDVEIKKDNVLVGKWYAPKLEARYDEKGTIYYEIHLDYDSIMDNEIQSGNEDE